MNKYQVMFGCSITLIICGVLIGMLGFLRGNMLIYFGIAALAFGLIMLGNWISKAYTYICMDCYLRIDVGVKDALFALPAGGVCRRIYCPKCRRRTACKARRISLRVHMY